ncbi:unnamed protein product [Prorocentrum cordatum]|uniref:Uncharacterized protein n=1 Tax=Prorocentrum cordatum TaxID=2364126 RepID=A0ABN9WSU4_9DINO|nr:unnamed protein product [Polarella glacialis]
MVAKRVLCVPPRAGRKSETALAAFTLELLAWWGAGGRSTLRREACGERPGERRQRTKRPPTTEQRAARAAAFAADGLLGKGCAALAAAGLATPARETALALERLRPATPALPLGCLEELVAAPEIAPNSVLKRGLELNLGKCELVAPSGRAPADLGGLFPAPLLAGAETGVSRVALPDGFELMGAPIGDQAHCGALTNKSADEAKPTLAALADLHPQAGLQLLRYCASFKELVCSARAAPSALHSEALGSFDLCRRRALADLLAADLTDAQRHQAARGLAFAGLGLRRLEARAPGACLASLAATRCLFPALDPACRWAPEDASARAGQALLAHDAQLPGASGALRETLEGATQKGLSAALDDRDHKAFCAGLSESDLAGIQSEQLPVASGFLEAPPNENLGLLFEPEELVTEVKRRLLVPVYESEHYCPCCDGVCD